MPSFANKDDRGEQRPTGLPEAVAPGGAVGCVRVSRGRIILFAVIAVCGTVADLLSKQWIFGKLWPPDGRKLWVWEPFVALELSLNEGALFGMGQGFFWLFALLSIVAALGILYWLFYRGEARDLWLCVALALVMGGILGNLYDRMGLHGLVRPGGIERIHAVRDWILLTYHGHNWPNFNIADSLLVCGAGMLLIQVFFRSNPTAEVERASQPVAPS